MTGATVAGVASTPFLSERAGQLAEEALGRVPKPMLAGLAIGVMVGAPIGYLWHDGQAPSAADSQAARVTSRRQAETAPAPGR